MRAGGRHRHTGGRLLRRTPAITLLSLLVGSFALPGAHAAFVATTSTSGNTWATAQVGAPTSFTATCVDSGRVDLAWAVSTSHVVTGYRIERRREGETDFTHLASPTGRGTVAYTDTATPFPSSLLSLLGTITVEYRLRAEVAGATWTSPWVADATSGTVTTVLLVEVFACN